MYTGEPVKAPRKTNCGPSLDNSTEAIVVLPEAIAPVKLPGGERDLQFLEKSSAYRHFHQQTS